VPSATELNGIAACLLDVGEAERAARLDERWSRGSPGRDHADAVFKWARWHRAHAADPQWRQEVIREEAWEAMEWTRWDRWKAGEPRWDVLTLATTDVDLDETARSLVDWIAGRRRLRRAGRVPLSAEWWRRSTTGPRVGG
jgi:hypothetical protein